MLKYDTNFLKAVSLALQINHLDNTHGTLNSVSGPAWYKKIKGLIDELGAVINSLDNSLYKSYIDEVPKHYPPEKCEIIVTEWSGVREPSLLRQIKQIFKRTQT